jgi:hypothetical protein
MSGKITGDTGIGEQADRLELMAPYRAMALWNLGEASYLGVLIFDRAELSE